MVFSRHHEQELAEIKTLTYELDRCAREGLKQLERIRESQDEALRRAGHRPRATRRLGVQDKRRASSAVDGNRSEPLLAFVHIPKTAGKTVITMLVAAYSKAEVLDAGNYPRNPEYTLKKVTRPTRGRGRVTAGHVPYGVLREHLPADTSYMTFLREPVDRVLSQYWRHIRRQDPRNVGRRKQEARGIRAESLEDALVEKRMPEVNNFATRFLSGHPSPPMTGDLPESALDDARASLREFAFIGIQERFEESLVLLQRMLEVGSLPYMDRHVSSDRPSINEISDKERALIEEHNRLDVELYRFGLGLFEDAVAAADEGFAADVEALRAWSAVAREEEWHAARLGRSPAADADRIGRPQ